MTIDPLIWGSITAVVLSAALYLTKYAFPKETKHVSRN